MKDGPNFGRFRQALLNQGEPDRVPLYEIWVDTPVKEAYLGRPIVTLEDDIEFWASAGYDYIPIQAGLRTFFPFWQAPGASRASGDFGAYGRAQGEKAERGWAVEGRGLIATLEDFQAFPWPRAEELEYSAFEEAGRLLPKGMKAMATLGFTYTGVWMLMGFEAFAQSLILNPGLVERIFAKIQEIQWEALRILLRFDCVGLVCMPDDIAYSEGLMVAPKHLHRHFFPWLKEAGRLVKGKGLPYMYHSDGKLDPVMETLVDCGFDAIHPFEPKAMDIVEMKRRYGDRICLMGNIGLDYTLTLGTPEEVAAEVKERLKQLAPGGGYCLGSSNSIPSYVPLANFNAMREAVFEYGRYPISL